MRAMTRHRRGIRGLAALLVLGAILALGLAVAGCGTETTTSDESTAAAAAPTSGGTLNVGMQPGNGQYDPVMMAGSVGDIILVCQVQENLVDLAQDFSRGAVAGGQLGLPGRQDLELRAPGRRHVQQRRGIHV